MFYVRFSLILLSFITINYYFAFDKFQLFRKLQKNFKETIEGSKNLDFHSFVFVVTFKSFYYLLKDNCFHRNVVFLVIRCVDKNAFWIHFSAEFFHRKETSFYSVFGYFYRLLFLFIPVFHERL